MPPRLSLFEAASLGNFGRICSTALPSSSSSSSLASSSSLPVRVPSIASRRGYVLPTAQALYAGPRTSRSFRRTRKEVEDGVASSRAPRHLVGDRQITPNIHSPSLNPLIDAPLPNTGLLRPVSIQSDPNGILKKTDGAMRLLTNSALVIVRQLEMLNVFMGFEQANRYAIMNVNGEHVGYLAEEDQGILSTVSRQVLRTHRPFKAVVMDREGNPVLWIRRPFALINSRMYVHAQESQMSGSDEARMIVGETQQEWHPWRRKYNVFKNRKDAYKQFARIDEGLFAWTFMLQNSEGNVIASIDRNFAGIARELFTDTGQYVIRFDAVQEELGLPITPPMPPDSRSATQVIPRQATDLTLDERAMALATAVTIDIDYFSRHSGSGMGFPMFMWGGGSSELHRDMGTGAAVGAAAGMGTEQGEETSAQESPSEESWWSQAESPDDVFEDPF